MADRLDCGDRVRREAPPLEVEQVGHPDDAAFGDEWHDELGLVAVAAHFRDLVGVAPRVVERRQLHGDATRYGKLDRGPLAEGDDRALPRRGDLASLHAGDTEKLGGGEQIDVARGDNSDLTKAIGRRQQDVAQLESRRKLQAGVVDDRQPATGLVELPIQRGVGHRLGGDLGEAAQELDVSELAGLRVEQADEAGHPPSEQQRQPQRRDEAELLPPPTLEVRDAGIAARVGDRQRLAACDYGAGRAQVGEGIGGARVLGVDAVPVDAHQAAQGVLLDGGDVAAGHAGLGVDAGRHRGEHLVEVERGAELETRVYERLQTDGWSSSGVRAAGPCRAPRRGAGRPS